METDHQSPLAEATLQRELEEAATDNDTRTIARIMAEIAEEAALNLLNDFPISDL